MQSLYMALLLVFSLVLTLGIYTTEGTLKNKLNNNNNNNNNNLPLIMVKKNCSTLHTVYNIQQSATQGSNDTTHKDYHAGQQQQLGLAQRV